MRTEAEIIAAHMEEAKREVEWFQVRKEALESDEGLRYWYSESILDDPVIRASAYPMGPLSKQELGFGRDFGNDPRRPVLMKGGIRFLYEKHSLSAYSRAPNGYYIEVIRRFFRRYKYTCFDDKDHRRAWHDLLIRLRDKHYHAGGFPSGFRGSRVGKCWEDGNGLWLRGKFDFFTDHQFTYLRKIWGIAEKIRKMRHYELDDAA